MGLCESVKLVINGQVDDADLIKISLIMTLHDCGFTQEEIKDYMTMQAGRFRDRSRNGWRC